MSSNDITPAPASTPSPTTPSSLSDLAAIRKIRFEQITITRESVIEKERTERLAREKARLNAQTPARIKYLAEQKKIREEAKAEKARILKNVEDDKVERRIKEAMRRDLGGC